MDIAAGVHCSSDGATNSIESVPGFVRRGRFSKGGLTCCALRLVIYTSGRMEGRRRGDGWRGKVLFGIIGASF